MANKAFLEKRYTGMFGHRLQNLFDFTKYIGKAESPDQTVTMRRRTRVFNEFIGRAKSPHQTVMLRRLISAFSEYITKTRLYKFDPLKSHFYIVKLGFTGVYIIFLISAQKNRLWVLVGTASPRRF